MIISLEMPNHAFVNINRISLEFPAGLLNVGEATEKGALRELQEETGYHGCLKVRMPYLHYYYDISY